MVDEAERGEDKEEEDGGIGDVDVSRADANDAISPSPSSELL
jgi:hypothetical protein